MYNYVVKNVASHNLNGFSFTMYSPCMPQSLNEFPLRQYALDDRMWAGTTR